MTVSLLPACSAIKAHANSLSCTPGAVRSFLAQLAQASQPAVQRELQEMASMKARLSVCGDGSRGPSGAQWPTHDSPQRGSVQVHAWDVEYLMAAAKAERAAALDAEGSPSLEAVRE